MKTKLTLTVEREVVTKVKCLARKREVSVSALYEQWSQRLAERGHQDANSIETKPGGRRGFRSLGKK